MTAIRPDNGARRPSAATARVGIAHEPGPAAPSRMAVVWRLAMATSLMVLAYGMTAPLLAVLLQRAGHSTAVIGAFAMLPLLMVALLIPAMPRLLAHWGVLRVYRWGSALQLLAALGYVAGSGLWTWAAASVAGGIAVAGLWNGTEALLAREAPPEQRGRVMGLYQTGMGAAFALGPFVPGLVGAPPQALLLGAAALVAACCLIAFTIPDHHVQEPPPGQAGTWHALRAVPALAALAFVGGTFEAGLSSVSAAYAASGGLGLGAAASVAGAIGVGSFLCQYPAGLAADRFAPRAVFVTASLLLLGASLLVALADRLPWVLWAAGAVWGGVGGALYTLTMVQVAHAFSGRAVAGGAAAMITGYTLGGTVGPLASGAILAAGGAPALSVLLCAAATLGLLAARRMRPGA
ncbi:MFS transporter [Ramlibacter rhizophilus]|uniref:MFS transporter n=1 Tax=Ramlibacter rhizophilus TaxID=1781167 RepID=A0A4Z0BNR7_9BURK|nr:MFS transporter [Ramlibacter rhizophilus]TFY99578.1 MFS transporter [Ramlibacter rhizophilus]